MVILADFGFCVNFLTLRVGDDRLFGVKEDLRAISVLSRSPPSFDDGQFAFVLVGGSLRRQANGFDFLGVLDRRIQRQDGDVVVVLRLYYNQGFTKSTLLEPAIC